MKKKKLSIKLVINIFLCMALILSTCTVATANPAPSKMPMLIIEIGGEKVVYEVINSQFWYPYLTDMVNMTRAEQQAFINQLNTDAYGGITDWHFASWHQTTGLKFSLARMATDTVLPWDFGAPLEPQLEDRTVSSPYLAWEVYSDEFFTFTGFREAPSYSGGSDCRVYNGRTADNAWGWRRNEDRSVTWEQGDADDHWMAHSLATGMDDDFATMMFNKDQHYLADDERDPESGAWVVSETGPQLWPPNHKFRKIKISSTKPYTISIDNIYQDEPVKGKGSGNTAPDGRVIGTSCALIRSERNGKGNGRVYHIFFTVEDGNRGQWDGTLKVSVPKNKNSPGVDEGPLYNSIRFH
jgi:hypothetical protein